MKAILIQQPGDASQLYLGETETPKPKGDELLVKVHATALNRADLLQREGKYPPPSGASEILGLDLAGVVEETGERVMGLLPGGGYAEYAVLPKALALPIPGNLSFEEAAAIPEVFLTAYQALFWLGRMEEGEKVLIHAGASGVGTAAIQLARERGASEIFVTASSERKIKACKNLGATDGINYREGPFVDKVLAATNKKGVDIVLDFIGAPYWEQNLKVLATEGRLILIAAMGGFKAGPLNILPFLLKRIQVVGTTLRARDNDYKARLTQDFWNFAGPRFEDRRLQPVVDCIFSWREVEAAHRYMEANKNIGKVVLRID